MQNIILSFYENDENQRWRKLFLHYLKDEKGKPTLQRIKAIIFFKKNTKVLKLGFFPWSYTL